ncbi:cytochrome C oxidase subunit IV family protein [Sulfurimonas sp.]|jgi:caa(3)-type oxidase subunit IV|uniref:cytochrome C oxidase subunit IV family protein n=1 Tax=Sulfurimonas sp. TaxID=2022749 RepID=UPI0025F255D8|nr:cytochrome C oxidase subunit IV family protein [Sulfurimonas sp.]MBT5935280.1 cytochrome C oxidase subunit IV family protein [Sulfurimonas sp.]
MGTSTKVDYQAEKGGYYKVLIGLLILTAVTFIQPSMFLTHDIFAVQMFIGLVKAIIILFYYMHLKGETLIGWMVSFSVFIVVFFFTVVIYDVQNFQYTDESHISSEITSGGSHKAAHSSH